MCGKMLYWLSLRGSKRGNLRGKESSVPNTGMKGHTFTTEDVNFVKPLMKLFRLNYQHRSIKRNKL